MKAVASGLAAVVLVVAASSASAGRAGGRFDALRVAAGPGLDYLDPALSYTADGWLPMFQVYLTLLGYRPVAGPRGAELVPVLARALPRISADGRTYRLRLRDGLRYSNGRPVRASDFAYTVRRLFLVNSPGVGFFQDVAGADRFARRRRGGISGIRVNDATGEIAIRLVRPRTDFANVLAALFAAPVPRGTPATDRSLHPIPATGPYAIASYRPRVRFVLERNPYFRALPTVPLPHPETVVFEEIADDRIAFEKTRRGELDWDMHAIPPDVLGRLDAGARQRLRVASPPNTWFFFLNDRVAPFDSLAVRRAVNYAISRPALARLVGGLVRPTENVLPPGYPQYRRLWPYPHDLRRARQLVEAAGARGTHVSVWTASVPEMERAAVYLVEVLNEIGLRASLKAVAPAVYASAVSRQSTQAQIGVSNWYPDYPHPADWFGALFDGSRITATHNTNLSNANDPQLNRTIHELESEPRLTPDVNERWSAVDRRVAELAFVAPYANRQSTFFFGPRIDMRCFAEHTLLYGYLFGQACVR
jgi:peptide/nickel transport system substrate-binding protein